MPESPSLTANPNALSNAAIESMLRRRITEHVGSVADLRKLSGGRSGNTWAARLTGAKPREIVVKFGTPGRPARGRHDMARQGRAMRALADGGPPVPDVMAVLSGDPQLLVTARVPGECLEPVMDECDDLERDVIVQRARSAARMLAHLHAVDGVALLAEDATSLPHELRRWATVMRSCDPAIVPGAYDVVGLLRRSMPEEAPAAIVHGDWRLGNLVCDDNRVRGVIDWEIWSIGDPRLDLGWFLLFTAQGLWPIGSTEPPVLPSGQSLLGEYESLAGRQPSVPWFVALARFKFAAITAHNLRRHREGRHPDPAQESFVPTIASMLSRAREELE